VTSQKSLLTSDTAIVIILVVSTLVFFYAGYRLGFDQGWSQAREEVWLRKGS
jgi:ammonia channel protein AmtB